MHISNGDARSPQGKCESSHCCLITKQPQQRVKPQTFRQRLQRIDFSFRHLTAHCITLSCTNQKPAPGTVLSSYKLVPTTKLRDLKLKMIFHNQSVHYTA
jgi:hypothetical protein